MKLLNNKKGVTLQTYFITSILLVMTAFTAILGLLILTDMRTNLTTMGSYDGAVELTFEKYIETLQLFDTIIILMAFFMIILIGITNYKIASAPVFFIVNFFLACIMGFISYFFNHLFIKMVSISAFSAVILSFPKTMVVLTNLHWINLAIFVVGNITLFGKKEKGQFV